MTGWKTTRELVLENGAKVITARTEDDEGVRYTVTTKPDLAYVTRKGLKRIRAMLKATVEP